MNPRRVRSECQYHRTIPRSSRGSHPALPLLEQVYPAVLRNFLGVPRPPSEERRVLLRGHLHTHRAGRRPLVPERSLDPRWVVLRSRDEIEHLLDGPLDRYGVIPHSLHIVHPNPRVPWLCVLHYT